MQAQAVDGNSSAPLSHGEDGEVAAGKRVGGGGGAGDGVAAVQRGVRETDVVHKGAAPVGHKAESACRGCSAGEQRAPLATKEAALPEGRCMAAAGRALRWPQQLGCITAPRLEGS